MGVINKSLVTLIPAMRISIALAFLTISILFSAEMLGFTPDQNKSDLDVRAKISESLALQFSVFDPDSDNNKIQRLIRYIVKRNPDILSCGIRINSGKLIFKSNNHENVWQGYDKKYSNTTHVLVPILFNGSLGGNVEIRYKELESLSLGGFFKKPIFTTSAYVLLVGFFVYLVFMLRMLKQLDPSSVIPGRVNAAFDTMSEGVFIVDENEQILLTNQAFSKKIGITIDALVGKKASNLAWERLSMQESESQYPWIEVLKTGESMVGAQLKLKSTNDKVFKFVLNASPIAGENNTARGVLVTLDDITEQEQRTTDLENTIVLLEETKLKVQEQNKELHYLATRDSLTGCLNRRSYGEQFEVAFEWARKNNADLCCLMVDLDHFKRVNDNFGHAVGDVVIKLLAEVLQSSCRQDDLIARYGGEEFCVVLPNQSIDTAFKVAERIRVSMEEESIKRFESGPHVTASIGIASIFNNPENPDQLNNMADEALYVAKSSGRNCVVTWTSQSNASTSET